jgi:hypothetical protein
LWAAIALSIVIHVVLAFTLPLLITFDGVGYIHMADIIGTNRFATDWNALRTPLYPAVLKVSFGLIGRTAAAPLALNAVMGFCAVLLIGLVVVRFCGRVAGALAIVALSLFPTLVTFEHAALTETGTLFFVALIVFAVTLRPATTRVQRLRIATLAFALGAGYLWRQNIGYLAPLVCVALWFLRSRQPQRARALLLEIAVVLLTPAAAAVIWGHIVDQRESRSIMLAYGAAKQALLPQDDPMFADGTRADYNEGIRRSLAPDGTFYSGLTLLPCDRVMRHIRSRIPDNELPRFFVKSAIKYPRRYASAVFRTWMAYAGATVTEDEILLFSRTIIAPGSSGGFINAGPVEVPNIRADFATRKVDTRLSQLVWELEPAYRWLTFVGFFVTLIGTLYALAVRNFGTVVFFGAPVAYLVPSALLLCSVARYAAVVHPLFLVTLIVGPVLLIRRSVARARTRMTARYAVSKPAEKRRGA